MRVRLLSIVLLTWTVVACRQDEYGLAGSRSAGFRSSSLVTEYRLERKSGSKIALAHVLFVPDRDVPAGGFGNGTSTGGTANRLKLRFHYYETDTGFSVDARPVEIIDAMTVQSGTRSFQLKQGNLFVALVHDDGSVDLTQLPHVVHDEGVEAEAILERMKRASPGHARVQAVEARKAAA